MVACVFLGAALAVTIPPVCAEEYDDLLEFAAQGMGIEDWATIELPPILMATQHQLQVQFYGAEAVADAEASEYISLVELGGLYDGEAVYVLEGLDEDTTRATIVHELVHHLQWEYGIAGEVLSAGGCAASLEADAYRIGDMYAIATGAARVQPLLRLLSTTCPETSNWE